MHAVVWTLIAWQVGVEPAAASTDSLPAGVVAQLGTNRFRSVGQMLGQRLSPDGRILATLGVMQQLRLWDVETGKLLKHFDVRRASGGKFLPVSYPQCAWSADGKYLAIIESQTVVRLYDGRTLAELRVLNDPALDPTYAVRFAPDNRTLILGSDEFACRFDAASGKLLHRSENWTPDSRSRHPFAVNPDGPGRDTPVTKVSANGSGFYIYNVDGFTNVSTGGQVYGVAASADARRVFAGDAEGRVTLWDGDTKSRVTTWQALTSKVDFLSASADGSIVAAGSQAAGTQDTAGHHVRIWKLRPRKSQESDQPEVVAEEWLPDDSHNALILSVSYVDGGRHLVTTSTDNELGIWNVAERRRVGRLPRGSSSSVGSAKSLLAAYGTNDWSKQVRIYDLAKPAEPVLLHTFEGVSRAALSHDGRRAAAMKPDREAKSALVWDVATHQVVREIDCQTRGAYQLLLSPDGGRLAIGGSDGVVQIWDVDAGRSVQLPKTISRHVLCFTPNGRSLITKADSMQPNFSSIFVWDAETGRLESDLGRGEPLYSFAMFGDNRRLLAGGGDGIIRVWDIATGALLKELPRQTSIVYALAVSPDGTQFASGTADGTIYLWDAKILPEAEGR
jgi:WD40 repeat protein